MKTFFTKQNLYFIAIFTILGFLALQVPVAQLVGSKAKFTLFDAFGSIAGSFIGTMPGVVAVFLMQLFNFFVHGANVLDSGTMIRFFPSLFAVAYFSRKSRFGIIVPLLAIVAFNVNPIGRSVWYFSLYWLIPIVCHFLRGRFLFVRALGATFTAHAVGGALWIWAFALPKAVWVSLIPVVAMERALFTVGIVATYVVCTNLLGYLVKQKIVRLPFHLESKYILPLLRA
ncbi:hypothetical protein HY625_00755 [Candidatus Uhrbacteria bacterium]|nr:hypothetical protein [Candidatus Uhrbacteria bacterium]